MTTWWKRCLKNTEPTITNVNGSVLTEEELLEIIKRPQKEGN